MVRLGGDMGDGYEGDMVRFWEMMVMDGLWDARYGQFGEH